MSINIIREAAVTVLAGYIGIAAKYMVQRTIDDVEKKHPYEKDPNLFEMVFFLHLSTLLPPEVPHARIKTAVQKALGR